MTCSGHCVYLRDRLMQMRGIEPHTYNPHHYRDLSFYIQSTGSHDLCFQSAHSLAFHADSIDKCCHSSVSDVYYHIRYIFYLLSLVPPFQLILGIKLKISFQKAPLIFDRTLDYFSCCILYLFLNETLIYFPFWL